MSHIDSSTTELPNTESVDSDSTLSTAPPPSLVSSSTTDRSAVGEQPEVQENRTSPTSIPISIPTGQKTTDGSAVTGEKKSQSSWDKVAVLFKEASSAVVEGLEVEGEKKSQSSWEKIAVLFKEANSAVFEGLEVEGEVVPAADVTEKSDLVLEEEFIPVTTSKTDIVEVEEEGSGEELTEASTVLFGAVVPTTVAPVEGVTNKAEKEEQVDGKPVSVDTEESPPNESFGLKEGGVLSCFFVPLPVYFYFICMWEVENITSTFQRT